MSLECLENPPIPAPPNSSKVKLIDILDESISAAAVDARGEDVVRCRQVLMLLLEFPSDIGEGRKAVEKKNVQSRPSSLNGAMRDDGW